MHPRCSIRRKKTRKRVVFVRSKAEAYHGKTTGDRIRQRAHEIWECNHRPDGLLWKAIEAGDYRGKRQISKQADTLAHLDYRTRQ
jgi:Protein of unknown function (DUF2934)